MVKFINKLKSQSFEGWTQKEKVAYLKACIEIEKKLLLRERCIICGQKSELTMFDNICDNCITSIFYCKYFTVIKLCVELMKQWYLYYSGNLIKEEQEKLWNDYYYHSPNFALVRELYEKLLSIHNS